MMVRLFTLLACEPGCESIRLEPHLYKWTYRSFFDGNDPHYIGPVPAPSLARDDLLCLLRTSDRWVSAHMLLSNGIEFNSHGSVWRDGGRYFEWNGLVFFDRSGIVTPDPRSRPCLVERWNQDPPRPELCWEAVMNGAK